VRKYGFHGISYTFILSAVAEYLDQPVSNTNIIALHLGSGASACAIKGGKSIDTTMGLTPAEGLPGATRSGTVDPTLVFHTTSSASSLSRASTKDLHITKAEDILNKHSGWSALTGTTDFGTVVAGWEERSKKETLAFEILVDRIVAYVGAYWTKLEGRCDALVFAGGIGEKSWQLREQVVKRCECLGFRVEERINKEADSREGIVIEVGEGKVGRALVCRTDEEAMMARECAKDERFW
jgi:acetate kinase